MNNKSIFFKTYLNILKESVDYSEFEALPLNNRKIVNKFIEKIKQILYISEDEEIIKDIKIFRGNVDDFDIGLCFTIEFDHKHKFAKDSTHTSLNCTFLFTTLDVKVDIFFSTQYNNFDSNLTDGLIGHGNISIDLPINPEQNYDLDLEKFKKITINL